MSVTASTRVLTLLGDPVGHSASPEIQNAAFSAAGVDGVYVAVRCGPEELVGFMRGLARAGGGGNITLPHKEKAASLLDVRSDSVRRTGACNTFWGDDQGKVHGDNTDVDGFRRALNIFLDQSPKGIRALLLGAGGAARAALLGLIDEGADEVVIYNRTQDRG
jgi:shikimate dehydrogenase